jgi:hypothetical protein
MAAFLSDEWFEVVTEEAASLPEVPGASLVMQHVVAGSPHGKVQAAIELRDGHVVEARPGKRADASCTVTWKFSDAQAALQGDLAIDVAFMRGDLKVEGDYTTFLFGLRPVFAAEAGAKVLAAIRARTD